MKLTVSHNTAYRYDDPVPHALQQLRLTPRSGVGQDVIRWRTDVRGGEFEVAYEDHHQNLVELYSFSTAEPDTTIEIVSEGVVETTDLAGVRPNDGRAPLWLFQRPTALTTVGPGVRRLIEGLTPNASSAVSEADISEMHELSRRIGDAVTYTTGSTSVDMTAEEAIAQGVGVCQDHAQIFVAAARELGFPARYVSGYLFMDDVVSQAASHAWAEVYRQDLGWVGLDVSNGISPDDRYIRIATGLDYRDAAPISGLRTGSGAEHLSVSLTVQAGDTAPGADDQRQQQEQMQQQSTQQEQMQ